MYLYQDPDGTSPLNTNKKLLKLDNKIAKNNKILSNIDAYTLGQLNRYNDDGDSTYLRDAKRTENIRNAYAKTDKRLRAKRQKVVDKHTGIPNSVYEAVGLTDENDLNDIANAYARGYTAFDRDPNYKATKQLAAGFEYVNGGYKDYKVSPTSDTSRGDTYNTRALKQLEYGKKKRR